MSTLLLLRTDPAFRRLKYLLPLSILFSAIFAWLLRGDPSLLRFQFLALCMGVFVSWVRYLSLRRRFSELQLALPVPSRKLLAIRIAGLYLFAALPLCTAAAISALVAGGEGRFFFRIATNLAACLLFAVLLIHLPGLGKSEAAKRPAFFVAVIAALSAVAAGAWAEDLRLGALMAALSLLMGLRLWRAVPPTISLATPIRAAAEVPQGTAGSPRLPLLPLQAWLFRQTFLAPRNILAGTALFAFGCLIEIQLIWLPLFLLFLATIPQKSLQVLRKIDHLPIGRRRVFPFIALPALLLALAPVAGAVLVHDAVDNLWLRHYEPVDFGIISRRTWHGREEFQQRVVIPHDRWKFGLGHTPPPVRAPWGEEAVPTPRPLFWGLPLHIYNPYYVSEASSVRFFSWQLSRAVEDVYAFRISPAVISRDYLKLGPSENLWNRDLPPDRPDGERLLGRVHPLRRGSFLLRLDYPHLRMSDPPNVLPAAFLCVLALWAPVIFLRIGPNCPPFTRQAWKLRLVKRRLGIALFIAVFIWLLTTRFADPSLLDCLAGSAFRAIALALPDGEALSWTFCLLLAATAYFGLERRFRKMEVPPLLDESSGALPKSLWRPRKA